MKTYSIGVIGAGAIAQNSHIPGYAAADNCTLTAIADPEPKCLEMVRQAGHPFAREYASHQDMLANEKLDAVSVCTPNKFHASIAIDCLNHGCNVLLEKPIALTLQEAEQIKDAAERNGKRVMVAFTHRFNALNHAAKKALSEGKIGAPYMYRIRFAHIGPWPGWAKTNWFYNKELAGGGALMDMAVHAFDLLRWYEGDIKSISALAATLRKPIEVDDNMLAYMQFKSNCLAYIECGWTSPSGFIGIEIMGDNGSITVDYGKNVTVMRSGTITPDGTNQSVESILAEGTQPQPSPSQMAYFINGLDSKEPYSPNLQDGIETLRLVLAAYESSNSGRRINL